LTTQQPINSPYNKKSTGRQVMKEIDLTGKTAIVTGGYSGIGLKVTQYLSKAGVHVIVPARTLAKAQSSLKSLPNVEIGILDLLDHQSIAEFASNFLKNHSKLDLLIESAGIMFAPLRRDNRGNESQLSTNYLGHFQLTSMLYPALKAAESSRVIIVTSRAQGWNGFDFTDPNFNHKTYNARVAYAQSKVADILFAVELDRRAKKDGIRSFAVHPGLVPGTGLGRFISKSKLLQELSTFALNDLKFTRLINIHNYLSAKFHHKNEYDYFKTVDQGAADILWAATSSLLDDKGGVFIEDSNIGKSASSDSNSKYGVRPWSIDQVLANRLWNVGEQLSQTKFDIK